MFYQNLKGDNVLKYISVLSTIEQNSSFCYRLVLAQMKAYAMWKRKKFNWQEIESVFRNRVPQWEDPQELLLVETINTPLNSYRVFPSFHLIHKYNLSQLLYLAHQIGFSQEKLSVVYALLNISDIIAQRFGFSRNIIGSPNQNDIWHLNYKDFNSVKDYTTFTEKELGIILENHKLTIADFSPLFLNAEAQAIKREYTNYGHSDTFELHPFLKMDNGSFLITFPSDLLRTAYVWCYTIMQNELGESQLNDLAEKGLVQETGAVLQTSLAHYLNQPIFEKTPFLWFEFDRDKIANVAIVLIDKNQILK